MALSPVICLSSCLTAHIEQRSVLWLVTHVKMKPGMHLNLHSLNGLGFTDWEVERSSWAEGSPHMATAIKWTQGLRLAGFQRLQVLAGNHSFGSTQGFFLFCPPTSTHTHRIFIFLVGEQGIGVLSLILFFLCFINIILFDLFLFFFFSCSFLIFPPIFFSLVYSEL